MVSLFFNPKDRETAVLLTDAIRKSANLEVLYYKVANNYILDSEIPKFIKDYVDKYNYIDKITLASLKKHKPLIKLRSYIALYQLASSIDPELEISPEIIKYPRNLANAKNIPEIIKLYGLSLPK
jgi:hypothetical protein